MTAERALFADAYQQKTALTRRGGRPKDKAFRPETLGHQPDRIDALLLVGVIDMVTGLAGQAAASFEDSIRIDPSQPVAHALLGDALLDLGRPQEALGNFERALQTDPRLIPAHFGRANALLDLKRPLEALASYENVVRLEPRHSEALFRRGDILLRQKNYAAALESYDRAIERNAFDADIYHSRGNALRQLHRAQDALESYDAALRLRGDFVEALCGRGEALLDLQRPEEALAVLDRAVLLRPGFADAHNGRGNSLSALKKYAEAVLCFDEALRLDPNNAAAIYNRANAMLGMGQRAGALASFKRAILHQPELTDPKGSRGDLLPALQRPETAAECLAELLQADRGFEKAPAAKFPKRSSAPVANFLTGSIVLTMLVSFAVSFGIMYRPQNSQNRSTSTLDAAPRIAVTASAAVPTAAAVRPPTAALQPPIARAGAAAEHAPHTEETVRPEAEAPAQALPIAFHIWNRRDLGKIEGNISNITDKPMSITMRAVSAVTQATSEIHFDLGPGEHKSYSTEDGLYMQTNDQLTIQSPPYQDRVVRVP